MENESKASKNPFRRLSNLDLTSGNLFLKLGIFALPIALTTILQLLYSTVDLASVHFWGSGENAASAISGNQALINLVVILFVSVSIGANVAIGNALGAKKQEHAQKVLHTSLIFSLFSGIVVGIAGYFATPFLLDLIGIEPLFEEDATTYMQIYFIGLPLLMVYDFGAQINRAIGDSTTPFIILLISGLLNVLFDFLFVYYGKLNVAGVAWATVISEGVSAFLVVLTFFLQKKRFVHLSWKEMRIDPKSLTEILKIGLPAGLQGFFFALPNTFIQSALYQIGAGNTDLENGAIAANSINNYYYAFCEATSSATMAVTAINYGAHNKENIKKAFWYGLLWCMITHVIYSLLIATCYRPMLSLFVNYENDAAIEAGKQRLWLVGFSYILDCAMDVMSGSMKGCRHTMAPAIITAITCTGIRILMIETMILRIDAMRTVLWLYSVYPISWVFACIADVIAMPRIWKKEFHKMDESKTAEDTAA